MQVKINIFSRFKLSFVLLLTVIFSLCAFFTPSSVAAQQLSCEWSLLQNTASGYNGRPAYCVGGFNSVQQLQQSELRFNCVSNCGSVAESLRLQSFGQTYSLRNADYAIDSSGKYYTCVTGDFDTEAFAAVERFVYDSRWVACGAGVGAVVASGVFTGVTGGGGAIVATATVPVAATACSAAVLSTRDFQNQYFPTFRGSVSGGGTCSADLVFNAEIEDAATGRSTTFALCNQIPESQSAQKQKCEECATAKQGIWTAVGCIEAKPGDLVSSLLTIGISIAGSVALLMILVSGFLFSTSQGDPKKTTEAKELLTAAVIGLLFIIFSVTILQFIGVQILRIPGFGGS